MLLPQEITEFANAGIMVGMATVNFAGDPEQEFDGFWGACSTYGSFSYLKYGLMRLFSQLAQDCELKVGKVIWVAGHSGPETAEDSRTHFGIFAPGVTQLFPDGAIINLHPWEYNEVPVLLGAALRADGADRRPAPDPPADHDPGPRGAGHPVALRGGARRLRVRDYRPGQPRGGTVIVQGTSAMANIIEAAARAGRARAERQDRLRHQPAAVRPAAGGVPPQVLAPADRADSTVITTQARWLMHDWLFNKVAEEYALSADWDDRWRTGGTLDEVLDEAHLSPEWILEGIERFVQRAAGAPGLPAR